MHITADTGILIKRASPEDATALTTLARRAKASWGYPAEWLDLWQADLTITPQYLEIHRVFKALENDKLAGMCAVEDHGSLWVLEHVWVDPAHQRKGIGRALVRHALGVVRELRPGILRLTADPHAGGFYLHVGAKPSGTQAAPMPEAPDRVIPVFEFNVV